MKEPKLTDLLRQTFGGSVYAVQGDRTWGVKPDWLDWPSIPLTEIQDRGWPTRPVSPEMPRRSKGAKA